MENENYYKSLIEIVRYIIANREGFISEEEIVNNHPKYGRTIVEELLANMVMASTKDGLSFDKGDVDALKLYLKKLGINV